MNDRKPPRATLFASLVNRAPNRVFLSIVLGGLAGIAYALLIPLVLASIGSGGTEGAAKFRLGPVEIANWRFAAVFFGTCMFVLLARTASQIMLLRVSMDAASDLRVAVYRHIEHAAIAALEKTGSSRLITVLHGDVGRILMGARVLPDLLISVVTLLGMLGFLLCLSASVFWFVIGAIAFGVVSYQVPMQFGNRLFMRARHIADDLQESVRGLLYGAKELKLDEHKRRDFFARLLLAQESAILALDKRANTVARAALNYGDLISFFVIGTITYVFVNYRTLSQQDLVGVIMALLYVTGPVTSILNCVPALLQARVSVHKLNAVLEDLPQEAVSDAPMQPVHWEVLRFSEVSYRHVGGADGAGFQVGPVSFTLKRGQITFIVGGNGSGKSTLSKLITLHYLPVAGRIQFGDTTVSPDTVRGCRQEIGAIYSDYHLFDRLLGQVDAQSQARIDDYLVALRLDQKVSVRDGVFSTLALSDGQRRRLALLVAFLEDKSLYLFDEWAADQDVTFKEVFYTRLLPELKARGKAVVVISHDDRFFGIADQVLAMEDGRLCEPPSWVTTHRHARQPARVAAD